MTALPLLLILIMAGEPPTRLQYGLDLDGREVGRFSAIERSDPQSPKPGSAPQTPHTEIELKEGWIDLPSFGVWLEAVESEPSRLQFRNPDPSRRPRVHFTLKPDRSGDPRQMRRSWTLLDACPLAVEVDRIDETGKAWLRSLVLSVGDFAAER